MRALHAAEFELTAVEAASTIRSRRGSKTTRDFIENVDLHPLSALRNIELAREKLLERTTLQQILPTSNYFKGKTKSTLRKMTELTCNCMQSEPCVKSPLGATSTVDAVGDCHFECRNQTTLRSSKSISTSTRDRYDTQCFCDQRLCYRRILSVTDAAPRILTVRYWYELVSHLLYIYIYIN